MAADPDRPGPEDQAVADGDGGEAGVDPTGPARSGRAVLWVLVAVALLPLLGAFVRVGQAGWLPEGDDAMIARRTMSVLSTRPPIDGQPSTAALLFADTDDEPVNASHAGPAEYWVLAVPYRLLGWTPVGLLAAVALVNGVAVVLAVWLAWRQLGTAGAVAAAVAVLVAAARLGSVNLVRPLNATILVLPLLAGLVATWAALRRDRAAVIPALALLSFVAQAHLGALPLAAVALVAVVVAVVVQVVRGPRPRPWTLVVGAVATVVVAWSLVLLQQVVGEEGNLVALWRVAQVRVAQAGPAFAFAAVGHQLRALPWGAGEVFPTGDALDPIGGFGDVAAGVLVVAGLVASLAWARRRDHGSLQVLTSITLATVVVSVAALGRGPATVEVGPAYQLSWSVAVVALVWCSVVAVAAEALVPALASWWARRTDGGGEAGAAPGPLDLGRPGRAGVAVLAVAALAVAGTGGTINRPAYERSGELADAIRAELPRGTYRLAASGGWAYLQAQDAISVELLRHGYDIRLVRLGVLPDEPQRRNTDVDAPTILIDSTDAPPPDGRLLASLGPLTDQPPPWNQPILDAVGDPAVTLAVDEDGLAATSADEPCATEAATLAAGADGPATRRAVVQQLSTCPAPVRRAVLDHLTFTGVDDHWLQLLRADLPAPYPPTGLSAWLVPA